eukprot:4676111-Pleurochrysis_carterae.AAC.2
MQDAVTSSGVQLISLNLHSGQEGDRASEIAIGSQAWWAALLRARACSAVEARATGRRVPASPQQGGQRDLLDVVFAADAQRRLRRHRPYGVSRRVHDFMTRQTAASQITALSGA